MHHHHLDAIIRGEDIPSFFMVDFIGVYDRVSPPDMCKRIIDFFEDNKDLQFRGRYVVDGETIRDPKAVSYTHLTLPTNREV